MVKEVSYAGTTATRAVLSDNKATSGFARLKGREGSGGGRRRKESLAGSQIGALRKSTHKTEN